MVGPAISIRLSSMYNEPMDLPLPKAFTKFLVERKGETGKKWLNELPSIVQKCQENWNFTLESNPYDLYTNFITPIRLSDGQKAILKIGYPGDEGIPTEMESLKYFNNQYSVALLESDTTLRAFIIEKLTPGTALRDVHLTDDAKATSIALPLLKNVLAPAPEKHTLPSLADWAKMIEKTKNMTIKGDVTPAILDKAQEIFDQLDGDKEEDKLLHGDLHGQGEV